MFKVQHERLPVPEDCMESLRFRGQKTKYPDARTMHIGDSVYYPGSMFETKKDRQRLTTAFSVYARSSSKKFVNKYDEDGGVRIWRVA